MPSPDPRRAPRQAAAALAFCVCSVALLSPVCCFANRAAVAAAVAGLAFCRSCRFALRAAVAAAVDLGGAMEIRAKKESDQSASAACVSMLRADGPRAAPDPAAARVFPWVGPRSRDAHERGAHGGRISGGGHQRVADISPDLCFSAVKNHGLSARISDLKSHFRCRPILLLDEDPTLELKTLVWGTVPLLKSECRCC